MNLRRSEFEKAYAEAHDIPVEEVEKCRMGDTYRLPMIAKCWRFWQLAIQADLKPEQSTQVAHANGCLVCGKWGGHFGLPCPQIKPISSSGQPAGEGV